MLHPTIRMNDGVRKGNVTRGRGTRRRGRDSTTIIRIAGFVWVTDVLKTTKAAWCFTSGFRSFGPLYRNISVVKF